MKKVLSLVLAALLMLSLLGCGGSSSSAESSNSSPDTAESGAPGGPATSEVQTASGGVETEAVQSDKIMVIATPQSSATLDPVNGYDYWYMLRYGVGETLMKFSMDMTPSPWLAESMPELSEDKLTWTVKIRDDVTFSNGEKLTAEKAKAALERQYEQSGPAKGYFNLVELKADGQILSITTENPVPIMPYLLADPVFVIYDTSDLTEVADKGPIATGPFVFSNFDLGTRNTSVVRNENYWGGEVKLAGIDFRIISDPSTLNLAMQNGELDAAYSMSFDHIQDFQNDPNYYLITSSSTRTTFGFMNMSEGRVFHDEALRQAITRLADRETYCRVLFRDQFVAGKTPLANSIPYGYDELNDINAYDPEGAAALLDSAGYVDSDGDGWRDMPDGSPLVISLTTYPTRVEIPLIGQALAMAASDVHLKINLDDTDQSTAWKKLTTGEYDLLVMNIAMANSGDPEGGMKSYFATSGSYNLSGYSNPQVDALFDELNSTFDLDKRIDLMKQIEQLMMDDSCCIYFCYPLMNFVTKTNVTGVTSHTSDYYWVSKDTGFID